MDCVSLPTDAVSHRPIAVITKTQGLHGRTKCHLFRTFSFWCQMIVKRVTRAHSARARASVRRDTTAHMRCARASEARPHVWNFEREGLQTVSQGQVPLPRVADQPKLYKLASFLLCIVCSASSRLWLNSYQRRAHILRLDTISGLHQTTRRGGCKAKHSFGLNPPPLGRLVSLHEGIEKGYLSCAGGEGRV
jgi:hypothetical protein